MNVKHLILTPGDFLARRFDRGYAKFMARMRHNIKKGNRRLAIYSLLSPAECALAFVGLVLPSAFLFDNYYSPEPTVSNFLSENIGAVVITGELLIFLVCGVVLGLCAVSPKVMLAVAPIIFVKGIIWDTYFLGRVYLVSIVVCSLSVMYLLLGWAVWYYRGNRRQK